MKTIYYTEPSNPWKFQKGIALFPGELVKEGKKRHRVFGPVDSAKVDRLVAELTEKGALNICVKNEDDGTASHEVVLDA